MDGKLKQKQSDMTFQMKVLLYRNRDFLFQYRLHVEEDRLAKAAERTRGLLALSASMRGEDDIEDDLDDMLEIQCPDLE